MARFQDFEQDIRSPIHIDQSPYSPDRNRSSRIHSAADHTFTPAGRDTPALVVFSLGNSGGGYTYSAHIVWILLGRRGQYREIGWLDDSHIGVLLPGSTLADALRFAESIRREIPEQVPLRYRVYCSSYPRRRNRGERWNTAGIPSRTDVRFTSFARVYRSEMP